MGCCTSRALENEIDRIPDSCCGVDLPRLNYSLNIENPPQLDINDIPIELLKEILGKMGTPVNPGFITRAGLATWRREFMCLVIYRMVSTVWLGVMDEVIEASLISMIEAWIPNRHSDHFFPWCVSRVVFYTNSLGILDHNLPVSYWPFIENYTGCNPFPGKCLKFSSCFLPVGEHENHTVSTVASWTVRFGHNISVLCLSCIELHINGLRSILKGCKNIKVLFVSGVTVQVDEEDQVGSNSLKFQLPVLKRLKSLLVQYNCYMYTIVNTLEGVKIKRKVESNDWLFSSYTKQLIKLEVVCSKSFDAVQLPRLKQLSIITTSLDFLQQFVGTQTCQVEQLSISRYGDTTNQIFGTIYDLFIFVGQLSHSLKELYIDVNWFDPVVGLNSDGSFGRKVLALLQKQQHDQRLLSCESKFKSIYKLTLNYPVLDYEKTMFVEFILPKFNCLCQLTLLRNRRTFYSNPIYYPQVVSASPEPFEFPSAWLVCSKLQIISVITQQSNEFTMEFTDTQSNFYRPNVV